jgi:hypothetical protein
VKGDVGSWRKMGGLILEKDQVIPSGKYHYHHPLSMASFARLPEARLYKFIGNSAMMPKR